MQTHVYANDQEIACKAAANDGVSPGAFPDPCWSPPPPKAGPIVIPYPNTCYAGSITNGTRTVFICGKEVAIEDHSYFATSTGNEPATTAFRKGVKTGVITGKAYFTQWSFDVIFEGWGVPRHNDLVSHNHGSMPSNTPTFPYLSRRTRKECKKEEERIERACAPEKDDSDTRKEMRKKSPLMQALKAKKAPRSQQNSNGKKAPPHWTDDHCDGLEINLGGEDGPAKALEYAKDMQNIFEKLPGELQVLQALKGELQDMAINAGAKALAKWGGKALLKQGAGSVFPGVGNTIMGVTSAVDAVLSIGDVNEIRKVAAESLEKLEVLEKQGQRLHDLSKEFKDFDKLKPEEQRAKAQQIGSEGQDVLATLNDCTRARKCNLVPKSKKDGSNKVETADGDGCCKGQTGHHLIYDAMMKETKCATSSNPKKKYEYSTAPTVCVEGFSQNHGSHGRVHDKMDEQVQGLANVGSLDNGTMSMDEAIDAAVKSHKEAFSASRCEDDCIRAQLEGYYKKKCPDARPKAVNKKGVVITPKDNNSR